MPISLNITQKSTGVLTTYHKAIGPGAFGQTSVTVTVLSYIDNQHCDVQGFAPVMQTPCDVSPLLAAPSSNPPANLTTFGSVFFAAIDEYLIQQQTPNPQSTVAVPLPPINGVFYGGTIVE